MTLLRRHRIASFLLAIVAIVAFSIAELDFSMLFLGVVLGRMVESSEFDATRPTGVWSDCSISAGSRLGVPSAELRFALDASDFVRSGRRFGVLASLVAFDGTARRS